jgi:hypothetical protein
MRKLSIILIMALILALVPLFSFASKASANRFPTISSASLESSDIIPSDPNLDVKVSVYKAVYNVTASVYEKGDVFLPDTSGKAFILNGYEGKIYIEVSSERLPGHSVKYTKDGTEYGYEFTESKKVAFSEIEIGTEEQIFLKFEHEVYFVGNIPSGKGIVKVQARNSIYDPDQFYLENLSKEGISKLKTAYETIDFYLFPATTISKDTQVIKIIDTYNYNKITDVPIPETIIHAGQVNNLDIYTSKDITLKLSSKPTNMNKFVVAPFMEDNWFLNWFIYFCKPFGDGKINSDGEVTFHDVPLGTWWFAPMKFGDDESWSYTFGARVKVEPTVNNPDLTQEIIVKPKKPSGKFDIRDVVTLSNQATGNEQEGYFFSNMIYGVRTQVIDDSHYFDSWFRK